MGIKRDAWARDAAKRTKEAEEARLKEFRERKRQGKSSPWVDTP